MRSGAGASSSDGRPTVARKIIYICDRCGDEVALGSDLRAFGANLGPGKDREAEMVSGEVCPSCASMLMSVVRTAWESRAAI
jgi:DNA-directed RNA polymerase subunit RPC12/RpoP